MSVSGDTFFSLDNIGLLAAFIIFGIQFVIIIYLVLSQKSGPAKADKSKDIAGEYRKCLEKNAVMYGKIDALKVSIADLETINVDLLSQKEMLQQSKAQLEELQTKKNELFEMAIHDIKNPAAAIQGYIQLLESYDLNAVEQQSVLRSLFDISAQIIDITQEMTGLIEKNKPDFSLKLSKVYIPDLVNAVLRNNRGYAQTKGIKLQDKISSTIPQADVDKLKIQEVVENLINNAIKYGPRGTVVKVNTSCDGDNIYVEVSDDGFGLSGEDIKNAFQKGTVLSTEPTGGEGRSGLGLWIVKRIVEEHGGAVKVQSTVGKGAAFTFSIPLRPKKS